MSPPRIREMTINDYEDVIRLWHRAGLSLGLSDTKPEIKRMLDHNPELCLVMETTTEKKRIIGAVLGGFDGRRGWVHHLAIDPDFQGRGLGRKMMDELINRFKKMKVVKVKLEVHESNVGVIEFYQSLGWDLRTELITMSLTLREDIFKPDKPDKDE